MSEGSFNLHKLGLMKEVRGTEVESRNVEHAAISRHNHCSVLKSLRTRPDRTGEPQHDRAQH